MGFKLGYRDRMQLLLAGIKFRRGFIPEEDLSVEAVEKLVDLDAAIGRFVLAAFSTGSDNSFDEGKARETWQAVQAAFVEFKKVFYINDRDLIAELDDIGLKLI